MYLSEINVSPPPSPDFIVLSPVTLVVPLVNMEQHHWAKNLSTFHQLRLSRVQGDQISFFVFVAILSVHCLHESKCELARYGLLFYAGSVTSP
jgi:hypothetical protein